MSLPVSQYEALLAEVRDLRKKAQRVQQLARPLIGSTDYNSHSISSNNDLDEPYDMDSLLLDRQVNSQTSNYDPGDGSSGTGTETGAQCSSEEKYKSTHMSVSSEPISHRNRSSLYHGTWPVERTMWNSEPTSLGTQTSTIHNGMDVTSVMSFASSSGGVPLDRVLDSPDTSRRSSQQLEAKVDMVYSLLAVLGGQEHADMGETLLALSTNPESCLAMRQSGCIPLLVQLVQSEKDVETKKKASQALHNLVHSQPDEKIRKRETRILKLLEQTRAYTDALRSNTDYLPESSSANEGADGDKHPVQIVAHLMKLSFDEGHRQAICQLGGIYAIATLVEAENARHGSTSSDSHCILMRRYACMALTNLTFGDSGNKALLCSFREFMRALVVQLQSTSDELRQVTASVLRNLSWRADATSKDILREVGSVTGLMKSAMLDNKENTLKSILSALWNLSAHCTENKSEICAVEGALGFLVDMLTYKTPTKSLAIIENSGGILRNISSQIAVRDDYREILRKHNCLQILLDQLKSPSLTIVSNACGALWNLSAKCAVDQEALWQMGAPAMLRSLNHSKHKMIAMGSSAALKNLLSARPQQSIISQMDSTALSLDLPVLPTLGARKQKALLQDLDNNLSELYENIEKDSPVKVPKNDKYIPTNDFIQKSNHHKSYDFITRTAIDTDNLTNSFASLNINEPSTSYALDTPRSKSKIPQSYGSTSLPYMSTSMQKRVPTSSTFIPVRNKFSDCSYENEIDVSDQSTDYGQKYSERNVTKIEPNEIEPDEGSFMYNKSNKAEDENFGIYAETDLDQPTDYSIRYAEDDSDSDQCKKSSKDVPAAFIHDTLKTYCTEDTPYETPLNFSTATSMSDLRMEEKRVIDNDNLTNNVPKCKEIKNEDEKERCSTEDISELENLPKSCDKIPKSEFSSGLLSPEKPINYCEEGTPGYFSRVSSFGSLNSIPPNETLKNEAKEQEIEEKTVEKQVKSPAEVKVVKFEQNVNYAEQTPLMFSRSSSLESLGSIDQHSIHDDRSSVVSDLSRLTSGIVSPSELPDSPTQTVPPSPKPRKVSPEFPFTSKSISGEDTRPQPAPRNISKHSVFEDRCTKFKEESTPVQFSTATSLSSLTIDDQDEPTLQRVMESAISNVNEPVVKPEQNEKKDVEKESNISDVNDELAQESEDDEDILAACIYIGMQNNRYNNANSSSPTPSKLPISSYKYQNKPQTSGIPLPKSMTRIAPVGQSSSPNIDTVKTYYTEDTPAVLSNAGSNSDLSNVSMLTNDNKSKKDYLSDDSSILSGDNDNILAECIQSGMSNIVKTKATCLPRRNIPASTPLKYNSNENKRIVKGESSKLQKDSNRRPNVALPEYLSAKDELESYGVENSPAQFSLRSSLSDLTADGSVAGLTKGGFENNEFGSNNQPCSSTSRNSVEPLNISQEHNVSVRESSSSISVESLESLEAEQALLEQCILLGMSKITAASTLATTKPLDISATNKPVGIATKQFSRHTAGDGRSSSPTVTSPVDEKQSKNVNVASVAGSTAETVNTVHPATTAVAADVREDRGHATSDPRCRSPADASPDKYSPIEEIHSTYQKKCGFNAPTAYVEDEISPTHSSPDDSTNYIKDDFEARLNRSCNLTGKTVDNRMLDPDAMIESLDRFTAELVSQASQLNKEDDRYKISTSDHTWDDDTSPNEITFPSISTSAPNVVTFKSDEESNNETKDQVDGPVNELPSNDFSSINTSTMTESTLIAFEANKLATAFKNEADMSQSITSVNSLELDQIQPPSHLNSMTNSAVSLEKLVPKSPKLVTRKKSLPAGLMIRRALTNSLNHGSSLESLENQSISNLDQVKPPAEIKDVFDMEASLSSVASLPNEMSEMKADFVINGILNKDSQMLQDHNPIFNIKHQANVIHFMGSSVSDIENMNPPSIFNEITDMCNSLSDIPTEAIGSETEIFEDCYTHVADTTLVEDQTEFTDANSITPIQSDFGSSSNESSPKKARNLSTNKQKRSLARERYKTYTIPPEILSEMQSKQANKLESTSEDYNTAIDHTIDENTYVSPTYSIASSKKMTPKEQRRANKSRYDTQVLDEAVTSILQQPIIAPPKEDVASEDSCNSANQSPARTKLSIRRNFIQKRLENKERFRTQTLSESSFSPDTPSSGSPLKGEADMHLLVQQEANLILKTLNETNININVDELLDCETVSLVSNDDDSEHNSGGSMNYRTYHKSWGIRKNNVPIIQSNLTIEQQQVAVQNDLVNCDPSNLSNDPEYDHTSGESDHSEDENQVKVIGKPKIVKPGEKPAVEEPTVQEEQTKVVRGRRKPLFSKINTNMKTPPKQIKPVKPVSPNVRNSGLKPGTNLKAVASKQPRTVLAKPPVSQSRVNGHSVSPKTSPARSAVNKTTPKLSTIPPKQSAKEQPPQLERQGTFTKEDVPSPVLKSKIPAPASKIPSFTSKIAKSVASTATRLNGKTAVAKGSVKSASSDRIPKTNKIYNRSTSADSRDTNVRKIQSSSSSQSLKGDTRIQNGAIKKSGIPSPAQRSNSNSSLNSNGSAKKQVTSKIASLWKKIEESKMKTPKNDTRVWIQTEAEPEPEPPRLIRSNTFDNKEEVKLRSKPVQEDGTITKRISRLGSFVVMDENEGGIDLPAATCTANV